MTYIIAMLVATSLASGARVGTAQVRDVLDRLAANHSNGNAPVHAHGKFGSNEAGSYSLIQTNREGIREEKPKKRHTAQPLPQIAPLALPQVPPGQAGTFEWSACAATPIHCGQAYYREVLQGFRRARSSVIIMGWRFEIEQKLFSERINEAPTLSLRDLIEETDVPVHILFWKNTVSEQKWGAGLSIAAAVNGLRKIKNVHVLEDDSRHITPTFLWSAHIKVVIFDRSVGYCGGIDFADTRLDTPEHILPNKTRFPMPNGPQQHGYGKPFQDVMVKVEGRTANDLASIAAERWGTWCENKWLSDEACGSHILAPISVGTLSAKLKLHAGVTVAKQVMITVYYDYKPVTKTVRSGEVATFKLERHDLAKRAIVVVESENHAKQRRYPIEQVNFLTPGIQDPEVQLIWEPFEPQILERGELDSSCRTVLSGDDMWLGATTGVMDIYLEHKRIIEEAKKSIYIENQYFGTRFGHFEKGRCAALTSYASNDIGELLYNKIVSHALRGEDFSVVIVIPLATEEPETQYPNLRSAQCMYEILQRFWKENHRQIKKPMSDYFGIYNLANVVLEKDHLAFYGIFVHSKLIVTDYDSRTGAGQAIVGSANLNDRSLQGDRDAEVSVVIRGAFTSKLMETLLTYHAGMRAPLPSSCDLAKHLNAISSQNTKVLKNLGIEWTSGQIAGRPAFNQNEENPFFDMEEAFRVGSGVHWKKFEFDRSQPMVKMVGHILQWNRYLWGDAQAYWSTKHHHPSGAW